MSKIVIDENKWQLSQVVTTPTRFRHTTNQLPRKQLFQYILKQECGYQYPHPVFIEQDPNKESMANVGLYIVRGKQLFRVKYELVAELEEK